MSTRIKPICTILVTIAIAAPARATLVTWAFEGDITYVSDRDGILLGQVNIGDTFSGSYTFESTTPDSEPHPRVGLYLQAMTELSGQVGGVPFSALPGFDSSIDIRDDSSGLTDKYRALSGAWIANRAVEFSLQLFTDDLSQILDDSLLLDPPALGAFSPRILTLGGSETAGISISADLSSLALIPEPGTLAFLFLGVAVVARRTSTRSRRMFATRSAVPREKTLGLFVCLLVLVIGTRAIAFEDCNTNGVDDSTDIAQGTSSDCNNNCVPDECAPEECPPIEIVFVFDTSSSMKNPIPDLCSEVEDALTILTADGLTIQSQILTIGSPSAGEPCSCCTDSVPNIYGYTTPGMPPLLGDCFEAEQSLEDWGVATGVVAGERAWTDGSLRIIFPISDEPPRCGEPTFDPGTDRDAIEAASLLLQANRVIAAPIVQSEPGVSQNPPPYYEDAVALAYDLATNGVVQGRVFRFDETNLGLNIADFVIMG